jgi:UDP-2,3-diacylglucosamine pyrophosphatase LpxH
MNYRAIWISDLHLGSRHAQAERLLDFLRDAECRHLYLVGDIVDGWELKRRWHWDTHANTVVQKILRKQRNDTRVTYLYGNHDEFLRNFVGVNLSGVRLAERAIHITADKRRFLVLHGHQLDGLIHFNRLLERTGARLYEGILGFNLYFNRIRRRLGFGYWSVAAFLKYRAKSAVRYVTKFEEGMVQLAAKANVHGVICGHIHRAEMRKIHGMDYLNCGDWVESCTALVEHFDGSFELLRFNENPLHGPGRRSGAHDPGAGGPAMVPQEPSPGGGRAGRGAPQPELAGLF